jgi:hypothetical protein
VYNLILETSMTDKPKTTIIQQSISEYESIEIDFVAIKPAPNQKGDSFFNTYVISLQIIRSVMNNRLDEARRLLQIMDSLRKSGETRRGGFVNAYKLPDYTKDDTVDVYLGNQAWLLLALSHYYNALPDKTNYQEFEDLERFLLNFVISMRDDDGGFYSGYDKEGKKLSIKISEANISALAALNCYIEAKGERTLVPRDYLQKIVTKLDNFVISLYNVRQKLFASGLRKNQDGGSSKEFVDYFDIKPWYIMSTRHSDRAKFVALGFSQHIRRFTVISNKRFGRNSEVYITGWSDRKGASRIFIPAFSYVSLSYLRMGLDQKASEIINRSRNLLINPQTLTAPIVTNDGDWKGAERL